MSFCKDCVKGVRHEGTPEGAKFETIGGVACYVATPTVDYPKDKALLLLTDVLGLSFVNNQLLTDDFARNGFKTVLPHYLHGDAIPADVIDMEGGTFDFGKWFPTHGAADRRPLLDSVIAALRESGVTAFGAIGYCFGGRYVFDLALDGVITAAAVAHPSLLQIPADLEKYAATATAPLLINSCTVDEQFPHAAQAQADQIFAGFAPGYKREYFEGCTHGFAVRGDLSDPKVKAGKEGAFAASVKWMIRYL
ncbi:dienelactone hydrolase endo-1,3,1,4-beta-D-glucanase [Mycena latifolia]|nr:dienelactone hydrolase endo-1,3,1,4-beta-D-glucanase [Mycena latifolia]